MIIAKQVRETLNTMPPGKVFTIADFDIPQRYQPALVKTLSRLANGNDIQKVSKGRYYKPKQTVFGTLQPSVTEVVKDLIERNGKLIGYITGTLAFARMGLTTQITSAVTIGTNKYRRSLHRGEYAVSFVVQPNPITEQNIPLLRILDAVKMLRQIPGTSPDDCVRNIGRLISALPQDESALLTTLAMGYAPYVRALTGAILDNIGIDTAELRKTLNGVTTYKLPVSAQALPDKSNWNIV